MPLKTHCHFCGQVLTHRFWEGRERLFCVSCNTPIYENPIPATCVVAADEDQDLVLVRRSVAPKVGFWCLPGGFLELGETPEQCALREFREETGLEGRIEMLLGVTTTPSNLYGNVLMLGYLIQTFWGEPKAGDDASEVGRFSASDHPELAFRSHERFVRIYRAAYSG